LLSEAVSVARETLDSAHPSHRVSALLTLGVNLIAKASHFGDIEDLKEGIQCMRRLLDCVGEETSHYIVGMVTAIGALLQQYEMNPSQHRYALTEAIHLVQSLSCRCVTLYS
jgi:hypothetical protein